MAKFWRVINYIVCLPVMIICILALVFMFRARVGFELNINQLMPFFGLMAAILLTWERIITIKRIKHLCFKKIPVLKPVNFLALFLIFNVSLLIACGGIYGLYTDLSQSESGTFMVIAKTLVVIFGSVFLILLLTDIVFIGVKNYINMFICFLKESVGVFLVYQAVFALLSFICSYIVIKTSGSSEDALLAVNGFMVVAAGEAIAPSFHLSIGSFFSSIAVASTYFALGNMALDMLKNGNSLSFKTKLKGLCFDSDTKFLLVMTVISLVFIFVTKVKSFPLYGLIFLAFLMAYGYSLFQFAKQKFIMFLITSTVMTVINFALPLPALGSFGEILGFAAMFIVRTLLFSSVGLLCGFLYYVNEQTRSMPDSKGYVVGMYDASILQVGAAVAYMLTHPADAAKTAAERIVSNNK